MNLVFVDIHKNLNVIRILKIKEFKFVFVKNKNESKNTYNLYSLIKNILATHFFGGEEASYKTFFFFHREF